MNSKDIKTRIFQLAESDPDGFGLLAEQLGKEEWSRCASHAAGFLSSWFEDLVVSLRLERDAAIARAKKAEAELKAETDRADTAEEVIGYAKWEVAARQRDEMSVQLQELVEECKSVTEECIKLFESYGADPCDASLPVKNAVALVDKLKKLSAKDI